MVEPDTFLTALYVMVDDFFKAKCTPEKGPNASLTRSEVVTLAVFGQWSRFGSERGFYRYAKHRLLAAFPPYPIGASSIGPLVFEKRHQETGRVDR